MDCVRQQVPLAQQHLGRTTAEAWFTTAAEQHDRFRERPDLLANAYEIAIACEVDQGMGGCTSRGCPDCRPRPRRA